jgi:hypothetical protein
MAILEERFCIVGNDKFGVGPDGLRDNLYVVFHRIPFNARGALPFPIELRCALRVISIEREHDTAAENLGRNFLLHAELGDDYGGEKNGDLILQKVTPVTTGRLIVRPVLVRERDEKAGVE